MSEQELYMISDDRARDEMGATNMLKKHGNMERVVEDYADTIRQLGERSRKFLDDGHPDRSVDFFSLYTLLHFFGIYYGNDTAKKLMRESCIIGWPVLEELVQADLNEWTCMSDVLSCIHFVVEISYTV